MAASILIVDDELPVVDVFARALKHAGYSVSSAENGRKALTALQILGFDLVLLDLLMPDMDGLEFLKELFEAKSQQKVIAMSGQFQEQFLTAAKKLGANAILQKPISVEFLLQVVDETLSQETASASI